MARKSDLIPLRSVLENGAHQAASAVCVGPVAMGVSRATQPLASTCQTKVHQWSYGLSFYGSLLNGDEVLGTEGAGTPVADGLLRLYLDEDLRMLERLRGEFVLAIWDGKGRQLHLATDRFRIIPLFYYVDDDRLLFASRLGSIRAWEHVSLTIDPRAIVDIMAFSVIPTPRTVFREIRKLPPGYVLTYGQGSISLAPYWDINFLKPARSSEQTLAHELKRQFTDVLTLSLKRDGTGHRIGTFLSGGVDSSTVTGQLCTLTPTPIQSFSIGFGEERFNEINYARIAANHFRVQHHEYFVTAEDTFRAIPILCKSFDEPFANASSVAAYYCAKLGKEHGVEVMYAGDGGDELFAGNERYCEQRRFDYYNEIPTWMRRFVVKPAVATLAKLTNLDIFVKGVKYIRRAEEGYPKRLWTYGVFNVVPLAELFECEVIDLLNGEDRDPYEPISRYYHQALADQELDRQLYVDLKLAIGDNDLIKVTTTAAAAGMTVRFPFLDHRLAEFAAKVPAELKMRGCALRTFFKRAYSDLLPPAVLTKTKHGFGLPIPIWLRTDTRLNGMMIDLVLSSRSVLRRHFRKKTLEELVWLHKSDTTSFYGSILWNLMILELWHQTHWHPQA